MAHHARHTLHQLRDMIARDPDTFARNVFTKMFALNPALRDLFPAQMTETREAFYHVIDHVLEVVPSDTGHADLVEFLAQLGRDHRKYGVELDHYAAMFGALMAEFGDVMGSFWDDDTQQTVAQAMMLTTGVMRGAAQTAAQPARWTGEVVEKFRITRDISVVRLTAHEPLTFSAGQFVEVQIPQWPRIWRNLSPAIPPNPDGDLEFHVRAISGGSVSTSIARETAIGDVWTFAQSHGTLGVDYDRPVLMVAGGTGLAPLRALLIEMSKRADAPKAHIFYGMRHPGELYDLPVLRRIASTNPWLTITAVSESNTDPWWLTARTTPEDLGIEHRIGRLDDVVSTPGRWNDRQVLIAGPAPMIASTRTQLIRAGVAESSITHDPVH